MKLLITGASGFIGGFLVEAAMQKGWEVWAGVRKTSDKRYLKQTGLRFIDLNYADVAALTRQIREHISEFGPWDYVLHNAGTTKCIDETDYYRINHQYTVQFVEALRQSGIQLTKFLYMSSMGAVGPGNPTTGAPLTLSDEPNPISAYGHSKLLAETYIRSLTDFPWVILRPTGVYGPRDRDYFVMIKMIKSGWNLSIGQKPQLLNFIHVSDLATACIQALETPLKHKTWFVADGDIYTSDEFSEHLMQVMHRKKVLSVRMPLFLVKAVSLLSEYGSRLTGKPALLNADKYKVMKQRNWTCDASELVQDLHFKPAFKLREGLEQTVEWYTKNGWL